MAIRRMFSKTITNSSQFLRMPATSRLLYYDLGMWADDDGYCEWFPVITMSGAKEQDLQVLEGNGFIHIFDKNVLIIKDWTENNYIRSDRYQPSKYLKIYEKSKLLAKNHNGITMDTSGIPMVDQRLTEDRLGKDIITSETGVSDDSSLKERGEITEEDDITVDFGSDPETGEPFVDSLGRRKDGKKPVRREGKNKIALRLVRKFGELAEKNCGTRPIQDTAGYFIVLDAMNKGGLNEEQIVKLFGDWFDIPKPDEELVQITRALSHVQVNAWKASNGIK